MSFIPDQLDSLNSSIDSDVPQKEVEQNTLSFYMVDDPDHLKKNDHEALMQKTVLLHKFHKRKEYKIQQAAIGWNLLFEIFFSKFFLIKFNSSAKKKFLINLREIEFRIRKEIGKNASTQQQLYKNTKEFTMLHKYGVKPPVSTWYEYNILDENLIDESERGNYVPELVSSILAIQTSAKRREPIVRRVTTALNEKRKTSVRAPISKRKTVTIDLSKFTLNEKKTEGPMSLLLTSIENKEKKKESAGVQLTKKDKLPYGLSKKAPHILKLFAFPKSVFNLLGKFEKKFEEKGYTIQEAEEELTNIQNDQKTYEVELRKNKLYMDNSLKDKKYLYDFRHLNTLFEKERSQKDQPENMLMKTKLEQMMADIDRIVNYELSKTK